jgi:hypothetical protein
VACPFPLNGLDQGAKLVNAFKQICRPIGWIDRCLYRERHQKAFGVRNVAGQPVTHRHQPRKSKRGEDLSESGAVVPGVMEKSPNCHLIGRRQKKVEPKRRCIVTRLFVASIYSNQGG